VRAGHHCASRSLRWPAWWAQPRQLLRLQLVARGRAAGARRGVARRGRPEAMTTLGPRQPVPVAALRARSRLHAAAARRRRAGLARLACSGCPTTGAPRTRTGARFGPRARCASSRRSFRTWKPVLKVHPFERLRVAGLRRRGRGYRSRSSARSRPLERDRRRPRRGRHAALRGAGPPRSRCRLDITRRAVHGPTGVVHFDAHPDTWTSTSAAILHGHARSAARSRRGRGGRPARMIQVGSAGPSMARRTSRSHESAAIEVVRIEAVKEQRGGVGGRAAGPAARRGPVYWLRSDIDAVDPALRAATARRRSAG